MDAYALGTTRERRPGSSAEPDDAEGHGGDDGRGLRPVESWVPAGSSPPLHVHHREDEAF